MNFQNLLAKHVVSINKRMIRDVDNPNFSIKLVKLLFYKSLKAYDDHLILSTCIIQKKLLFLTSKLLSLMLEGTLNYILFLTTSQNFSLLLCSLNERKKYFY